MAIQHTGNKMDNLGNLIKMSGYKINWFIETKLGMLPQTFRYQLKNKGLYHDQICIILDELKCEFRDLSTATARKNFLIKEDIVKRETQKVKEIEQESTPDELFSDLEF